MKKFLEMKKMLALGLTLIMLCGLLPVMPAQVSAESGSNTIQFFVATNGSDQNPGTQRLPFKTLEKAKMEIRKLNMTSDVVVYLRGGEYFLDDTFWLGRADSGENGYTVTYQSYPSENAVINGGSQVTGWEQYNGNIYRAYVGTDKHFTMLSENGEASTLARTPNSGYNLLVNPAGSNRNDSKTVGYFSAGDVPQVSDLTNLQMYVWGGGATGTIAWGSDIIDVTSIDYGACSITLASQASYELGGGSRYYLRGAMEFLDSPGEFYMNQQDGYLYYYPKNFPIEDQTIVMPFEKNLIEVRGDNYGKLAGNLIFKDLHLVNADYGKSAIYGKFIENVTVKDCIINNIGGSGIYFDEEIESCRVEGCHIYDTGSSGINFYGSSSGYFSKNNKITNNMVHDTGMYDGGSGAINLWQTGDTVVSHNTVYDTPRFSICVSSPRDDTVATDYARNITVEYNDMWNANTDSQDTGVFYTWCASGGGNVVRNNNIHDSNIYFSFGYGLYLDDKSDGWQVYNNVIHDLQKDSNGVGHLAGSVMVKGISPVVTNNILANNDNGVIDDGGALLNETRCDAAFTIQELASDLRTTDAHITHNIVAFHENPNIYRLQIPTTSVDLGESDYNLYYREYTSTWSYDQYRFDGGNEHNPSDFPLWLTSYGGKYDQNSLIDQNPAFMDMANQDYRVRYDSPAYSIGFNDINMEDMGVTSAFRYGNSAGALRQAYIRAASDTVNRSWTSLTPGQSENLIVSARTTDGSVANLGYASVSYSSDNAGVASVDASGRVTAHSAGTARITATVSMAGTTKTIAMDILVGDRAVISGASAGNTQMDGTLSTTSVSSMSLEFASAMDASSLTKDTVKVFVGADEITDYTLSASQNGLTVYLPTALSYGESARVVLTTAVKWADGRNIPYEASRGVTVADLADENVAPRDDVYESPIIGDPGINYYSYLDFENETLGKTPGGGGNEISGLQFYNWRDTNIVTDPAGGDNQVLRIFKPVAAGDMSIDNMKMFEANEQTPVTTFETKIYIDELFTEWMIQAVSGGWAKANILYFGYTELETDIHDAVKRPIPDIGYIRAYNGSTEVKHTGTPIFENTWYTLTMTFDMVNQKYSVYIDGEALFTDYTLPLSGDFRGVRIYNNLSGYRNDSTIYLDDYCVYEGVAKFGTPTGEVATQAPTPVPTATPKPTAVPTPAPVTEVPVTEVPVTEVPVTEVPVTEVPVTEVPVTEVPVTEVPVTEVPVTEVPVTEVPVTEVPVTEAPTQVPDCYLYEVDTSSIGNNFDHNLGWQNMQDRTIGASINRDTPNSTFVLDPATDINTALKVHKSGSTYVEIPMPFSANSDWNTPNWSSDDYRKGNTGASYEFKIKATNWDTSWTLRTNWSYDCFTLTGDGVYTNSDNRLNAYEFEENKWYRIVFFMTGWNSFNLYIDAEGTENDVMFESLGGQNNENRIHGSDIYGVTLLNRDSASTDAVVYVDDVCVYKNGWDSAVSAFMTRENSCPYIGSGSAAVPTEVPVTEVPVTEVPVTDAPVTEVPATLLTQYDLSSYYLNGTNGSVYTQNGLLKMVKDQTGSNFNLIIWSDAADAITSAQTLVFDARVSGGYGHSWDGYGIGLRNSSASMATELIRLVPTASGVAITRGAGAETLATINGTGYHAYTLQYHKSADTLSMYVDGNLVLSNLSLGFSGQTQHGFFVNSGHNDATNCTLDLTNMEVWTGYTVRAGIGNIPADIVTEVPATEVPVTDAPDTEVELLAVDTSVLGGEFDSNVGFQNMQNCTVGSSINGSETFATFQLDPAANINTVYAISKTSSGSISASMPFSANSDWNVPNWSNDSYRKGNTGACYEFKVKADSWDTSWTLRTNWSYNCFTLTEDGVYTNSDNRLTPYNFEANKWYRIVFVMTGWNSFNLYIDAEGSENDVLITGLGGQNNENRIHASDIYSMRMENTDGNSTNATLYIDDVCIYKNCWSDTVLSFIQRNNSAPISGIQAQ